MADKNTGALSAAGTLGGSELVHIVDASGNSRKLTLAALKTFINTDPTVVPSSVPYRGARVRRTSDLSITTATNTTVSWQAEDRDTDNIWSVGAPTRLVVPTGVTKVRLRAGVRWAANATGIRQILTLKNGVTFHGRGSVNLQAVSTASEGTDMQCFTDVIDVVAGDYFELVARQTSGGALNLVAHETTWFALEIVQG